MKSLRFGVRSNGDRVAKQGRTESAFQKERARIRAANDEKTVRLRALRLAKEKTEREAAAQAEAEKAARPAKAPRRVRVP